MTQFRAQPAKFEPHGTELQQIRKFTLQRGRFLQHLIANEAADVLEHLLECFHRLIVGLRKPLNFAAVVRFVIIEKEVVVPADRQGAIHFDHFEPMILEVEIFDDLVLQQTDHIGNRGNSITRMKLLGDHRTTDHGTTFQNQCLESGSAQVSGRGQSVVATSDDDRVILICHSNPICLCYLSSALFSPLLQMGRLPRPLLCHQ